MGTVTTRTEEQLVTALRERDEEAFAEAVRRHHRALVRVAQIYVPSRAVAEEVVQETWLAVLDGIDRFEGRSSFRTWLFGILVNLARTRAARERRTLPLSALAEPALVPEASVSADRFLHAEHRHWPGHWAAPPTAWSVPEERLLAAETRAELRRAIEDLPPAQRAVVTLRDVEGWSAEDVSEALGLTDGNQRVLLHRGRSKVRRVLDAYLREEQ